LQLSIFIKSRRNDENILMKMSNSCIVETVFNEI